MKSVLSSHEIYFNMDFTQITLSTKARKGKGTRCKICLKIHLKAKISA